MNFLFWLAVKMGDTSSPSLFGQKRPMDQIGERPTQMKIKRMNDMSDSDMNDSIDNMTSDDMFLPQVMQPQVTINESPRFDANLVKRESSDAAVSQPQSPNSAFRNSYRKLRIELTLPNEFTIPIFIPNQRTPMRARCTTLPFRTTLQISRATTWQCRMRLSQRFTWTFRQVRVNSIVIRSVPGCSFSLCKFYHYHSLRNVTFVLTFFRSLVATFLSSLWNCLKNCEASEKMKKKNL